MQIKAVIALTVFYVERHGEAFEKTLVKVIRDLAAAMVAIRTEISGFSSVSEGLTMTFVVSEAVESNSNLTFSCCSATS